MFMIIYNYDFIYRNISLCRDDSGGAFSNESFHLEIEHDSTYWHIKSVNLKQDHIFNVDEMVLKLNPISCYSGTNKHFII